MKQIDKWFLLWKSTLKKNIATHSIAKINYTREQQNKPIPRTQPIVKRWFICHKNVAALSQNKWKTILIVHSTEQQQPQKCHATISSISLLSFYSTHCLYNLSKNFNHQTENIFFTEMPTFLIFCLKSSTIAIVAVLKQTNGISIIWWTTNDRLVNFVNVSFRLKCIFKWRNIYMIRWSTH